MLLRMWEVLFKRLKTILKYYILKIIKGVTKVTEAEDNTDLSGELACAGGSCEVV